MWINANAAPSAVRSATRESRTRATVALVKNSAATSVADTIPQPSENALVTPVRARNRTYTPSAAPTETAPSVLAPHPAPPPRPEMPTTASPLVGESSRSASLYPMVVYTDGSCRGNGRIGSTAGVGVWWGADDSRYVRDLPTSPPTLTAIPLGMRRNVSERCPGNQTNNRAELIVSCGHPECPTSGVVTLPRASRLSSVCSRERQPTARWRFEVILSTASRVSALGT